MDTTDKISGYHPEVIDNFLKTGKSGSIPENIQKVIMQMTWAMEIYEKERNITRAAKKLVLRVQMSQGVSLNIMTAKSRIYSALSYFDTDINISKTIWLRDSANKFEDLAKFAVELNKPAVAEKCLSKALECRLEATEQENNNSLGVVYILSSELCPEDLGFKSKNKKEIARKANDGFYIDLINRLDVDKSQRKQLIEDCEIIEEVKDNE